MSLENKIVSTNSLFNSSNSFVRINKIDAYSSGELSGLTFAIKDNIDVANEVTGYGSPCWAKSHSKPVVNAICLDQLLSTGATCFGKTHTDELAYSLIGVNSFYGTPLNPKAPDRVPGGSSSGSASATACGLVDFAIGTDTAGSIRFPASNCGIWGYRPSHGIISVAGVAALAPSFDTVGVFATSGKILEKVMRTLLAESYVQNNTTLSVCFIESIFQMCDSPIREALTPIIAKISHHFITTHSDLSVITDEHVNCEWLFEQVGLLLSTEVWNTFGTWVENEKPELSSEVANDFINFVKPANRRNIQSSLCKTKYFSKKLNEYLSKGNILCFPTTVDLAPKLEQLTDNFLGHYYPRAMGVTAISGLSRTPEITIPITECNGVPIGLSFIAGYGQDMVLAKFCNELYAKLVRDKVI